MAPDYLSLIGLRFVAGLPHGAYFGIAALIAASMVDVGYRARAVGRVMLGLTTATLIGMPLATWLGRYGLAAYVCRRRPHWRSGPGNDRPLCADLAIG